MADKHKVKKQTSDKDDKNRTGVLEKIFTIFSVVLLLAIAGYLVKQSFTPETPPAFKVDTEKPAPQGRFQSLTVRVRNIGSRTAKAVNVQAEAPTPDGEKAEAEATLDWLPGHSTRKVTLIFPGDADTSATEAEVVGYEEP